MVLRSVADVAVSVAVWTSAVVIFLAETCFSKSSSEGQRDHPLREPLSNTHVLDDDEFSKLADELEGMLLGLSNWTVISMGITGSGRSSFLNTLCDSPVIEERGGQLKGTRGCKIVHTPSMTLFDVEGLRGDKRVHIEELGFVLESLATALHEVKCERLTHVTICLDLETRLEPATLANLLSLLEVVAPLRHVCFLVMTRWHTASVMAEWNHKLLDYWRKNRRKRSVGELEGKLPTANQLMSDYLAYVENKFGKCAELSTLHKLKRLLGFFEEDKVVWAFSLDSLQREDRGEGELDVATCEMYSFYRTQLHESMRDSAGSESVNMLPFLSDTKEQETQLCLQVARDAIDASDEIIAEALEAALGLR